MSAVLDAVMGKQVTAWKIGGEHAIELGFEDDLTLSFDALIDEDDDLSINMTLSGWEEPPEPESAQDKYAQLARNVENVYTHTVTVDNVSGALVCEGCKRENAELGEEPCNG